MVGHAAEAHSAATTRVRGAAVKCRVSAAAHLLVAAVALPAAVPARADAREQQADGVCGAGEQVGRVEGVRGGKKDVHRPLAVAGALELAVLGGSIGEQEGDGHEHEVEAHQDLLDADGLVLYGDFAVVFEDFGADKDLEYDLAVSA